MRRFLGGFRPKTVSLLFVLALIAVLAMPTVAPAASVLTIRASKTSGYPTQTFYVGGSVSPAAPGAVVTMQYRSSRLFPWTSVKRTLSAKSTWSYKWVPTRSGKRYFRFKYAGQTSPEVIITIKAPTKVTLASTSSTTDSGLFYSLIPAFERRYPQYFVDVLSLGSGQAIQAGKDGNADVLLVHDKDAELAFMSGGWGVTGSRHSVMANHFVIVGPKSDPAKIAGSTSVIQVLNKIRNASHPTTQWIARSDKSGTNTKNDDLWTAAGGIPTDTWYVRTNSGMGATLTMASQKQAYTISDDSTFLYRGPSDLAILYKQKTADKGALNNQYSVMLVKNAAHPAGASAFSAYIRSYAGQKVIGTWGVSRFGFPLFTPNAGLY